jgi:hypothetical protein
MSVSFRVVKGLRVGRYQTYGSRWGPGKVHRYYWDAETKEWRVACASGKWNPYGRDVDRDEPVTCKKCLGVRR